VENLSVRKGYSLGGIARPRLWRRSLTDVADRLFDRARVARGQEMSASVLSRIWASLIESGDQSPEAVLLFSSLGLVITLVMSRLGVAI
jgi:hypothetical protein